ncbi:MAG: radical SAM protein [Acidimicrobiaceae bacterium]|nr:radical SAM protein [Acidimicrobiaceae bacterium]
MTNSITRSDGPPFSGHDRDYKASTSGFGKLNFSLAPLTLAWEVTRACPLRCIHCRAEAQPNPDANELTTEEGFDLIDDAAAMGTKVFVITGGDPLARPDIFTLLEKAVSTGMYVGFSPSVTGRIRDGTLEKVAKTGVGTIHISLDGAGPESHDLFRGVKGHFERTIQTIRHAAKLSTKLQVATTVSKHNLSELTSVAQLLEGLADSWTLFFLVATGRANSNDMLTAKQEEEVLHWLASTTFPFYVRTVEAPQYRRVRAQMGLPITTGVTDGNGFCFISHTGDVQPSGFLPVTAGNIRQQPASHWYRGSQLFTSLRDPAQLGDPCGSCQFAKICGGSRARAWAATKDPLAGDPTCEFGSNLAVIPRNTAR